MDVTAPQPTCPEHLEMPSHSTCVRCGRFVCEACLEPGAAEHCGPCARRLADPLGLAAELPTVQGFVAAAGRV